MHPILARARELKDRTIGWRRDLHAHPEIGFQEVRTGALVAKELQRLGYQIEVGVGRTGVVGVLAGGKPGACILLRFDMDALPIQEETGVEYASINPGVMHACGHDGHVAVGLTVANILREKVNDIQGTIKLIFQPAEEGLGGAAAMIKDEVMQNPQPKAAFGLHLWNEQPVGWAAITAGAFMASSDMFRVKISGKGGHGALPQNTADPLLAGALVVNALQSVVSRNVSPLQPAVVSVTQFQGGTALNIIPDEVTLGGTVRTYDAELRNLIIGRMKTIIEGVSASLGCEAEFEIVEHTPAVTNAADTAEVVQRAALAVEPGIVIDETYRSSMSEDMSLFLQAVPGCFFFVGSAPVDPRKRFGHHHPKFDIDEEALPLAAGILTQAALSMLAKLAGE
ncbi:MAG: hypothetical protein A2X24_02070 [Chloroflexi bacterium GWB2_54_36]|nr:MAG: hypothetical protein A2X24_02070 [Chloroflexi bacterium GWB2_54_36]HBA90456.1 amidohydrolase [Anaerolineaceae bacterium]